MALVTALWWIVAVQCILLVSIQWVQHKNRMQTKIFAAADHLYLAEGVLAREVARLKKARWATRWYRTPGRTGAQGASLIGTFENAEYTGHVQDVTSYWDPRDRRVLENYADIFLKITYPAGKPDATAMHFFYRTTLPDPTALRPTAEICRRFAIVREHDPANLAERDTILAQINADERRREANRAETDVLVREIEHLVSRGAPIGTIGAAAASLTPAARISSWSLFATPAHAGAGR